MLEIERTKVYLYGDVLLLLKVKKKRVEQSEGVARRKAMTVSGGCGHGSKEKQQKFR